MTQLIQPDDSRYFTETSIESYERHDYKVVYSNGKSVVVDCWEKAQMLWFQSPKQFLSHIEVLDSISKKQKRRGF